MYKKIKRNTPSILVILFTLLFFSIQSKAVVTVDNSASAGSSATPTTLNWTHTVNAGNSRALYVTIARYDAGGAPGLDIFTTVTFNSTAMTLIGHTATGTNSVQVFGLLNPDVVIDGPIVVTLNPVVPPITQYSIGTSVSFFGVDQMTSLGSFTTQTEQGTQSNTPNNQLTGTEIGDIVLDILCAPPSAGTFTPGMGQTLRGSGNFLSGISHSDSFGGNSVGASSTKPATSPNTDLNWTMQNASTWILGAVRVKAAAPTAASGTISGRVLSHNGRGIPRVSISLSGGNGDNFVVRTNSFGFFRFQDLELGNTYVIQPQSKSFFFAPQVVTLNESIGNMNLFPISK